jgi:hypothetical protein
METNYKTEEIKDVILVSNLYFTYEQANQLSKDLKKPVIIIPLEVDDIKKAINFLSKKQIKQIYDDTRTKN